MTTEELRTPEPAKPPKLDQAERISKRIFFSGLGLNFVAYALPLAAGTATGGQAAYDSRSGAIFGTVAAMILANTAMSLTVVGGLGWIISKYAKPFWDAMVEAMRGTGLNQRLISRLTQDVDERYRDVTAIVGAMPGRISNVEDQLGALEDTNKLLEDVRARLIRVEQVVAPELDYGAGVEHGLLLSRDARGDER